MRMKLDRFDRMAERQDAEGPEGEDEIGVPLTTTTTSEGSSICFLLGAPEKQEKPLSDLTGATKFSISNLSRMLEDFLNRLRIHGDGYYKVRKEHMVSVLTPLLLYIWKAKT